MLCMAASTKAHRSHGDPSRVMRPWYAWSRSGRRGAPSRRSRPAPDRSRSGRCPDFGADHQAENRADPDRGGERGHHGISRRALADDGRDVHHFTLHGPEQAFQATQHVLTVPRHVHRREPGQPARTRQRRHGWIAAAVPEQQRANGLHQACANPHDLLTPPTQVPRGTDRRRRDIDTDHALSPERVGESPGVQAIRLRRIPRFDLRLPRIDDTDPCAARGDRIHKVPRRPARFDRDRRRHGPPGPKGGNPLRRPRKPSP